MGLLKKLAGLLVEFPEEARKTRGAAPAADAESDVVASIEQIRLNIERSGSMDFGDPAESGLPPVAAGLTAQDSTAEATGNLAPPATPDQGEIRPPVPLTVQQVYEKAGLKPDGEFDIFKVERMLNDPEIADLAIALRARMVRMTLKNMGRDLKDILNDAGLRDMALEQYLDYLQRQVAETEVRIARANEELQQQIDQFVSSHTAMIANNNSKLQLARNAIAEFKLSKSEEEQRLFEVAAPFVGEEANPVKLD